MDGKLELTDPMDPTEGEHRLKDTALPYVRDRAVLACIGPPPGTDVRAVQTEDDPAPIMLGSLDVDSAPGE